MEKLEMEVILKNVYSYKEAQISDVIAKYKIVATETKNKLTKYYYRIKLTPPP